MNQSMVLLQPRVFPLGNVQYEVCIRMKCTVDGRLMVSTRFCLLQQCLSCTVYMYIRTCGVPSPPSHPLPCRKHPPSLWTKYLPKSEMWCTRMAFARQSSSETMTSFEVVSSQRTSLYVVSHCAVDSWPTSAERRCRRLWNSSGQVHA